MAPKVSSNAVLPGAQTLNDIPKRAFVFLNALGTQLNIRAIMKAHGYMQEDHLEGWKLLMSVSDPPSGSIAAMRVSTSAAIAELDAWDEVGFRKANATLARHFPEQAKFVFDGLAPSQGPAAVVGVAKFLQRLDALEKGEGRAATKDADTKALEQLAKRGIDAAERARLRALVDIAQSEPEIPLGAKTIAETSATRTEALGLLYAWYSEWSEIARVVVSRRNERIALGLAKRRKGERASEVVEADETPTNEPTGTTNAPATVAPAAPKQNGVVVSPINPVV